MDSRVELLGCVQLPAREPRELDPDLAPQVCDPVGRAVERALKILGVRPLRGDRAELSQAEDRVVELADRDPQRQLGTALIPLGIHRRGRDHSAELARDAHGVLRGRGDPVRVRHAERDPHVDVLRAAARGRVVGRLFHPPKSLRR